MCKNGKFTEEELFAIIAHEIGHAMDNIENNTKKSLRREEDADNLSVQLGLGQILATALNKMIESGLYSDDNENMKIRMGILKNKLNVERKELLQQFDDCKRQYSLMTTDESTKNKLIDKMRNILRELNGNVSLYRFFLFEKSIDIDTATITELYEVRGNMSQHSSSDGLTAIGKERRDKMGI